MQRPTLSVFRAQVPTEALGICQSDPKVAAYCNESQERLLLDPLAPESGWWGTWMRMNLSASVSNGVAFITTPREVAAVTDIAVCKHPIHLRNGFYEFLNFSKGIEPKNCRTTGCGSTFQAFERDNVPTLMPLLSTPQIIRMYPTDARDSGFRVLLQGKDQNGQTILTTDPNTGTSGLGEYVSLKFPFVDSVNQYSQITGILKDQTYGVVQFFQVNPVTGAEAALSVMEPNEGTAWYRRYMVNGIPNTNLCCTGPGQPVVITANVRLDFIPVENEVDFLTLPNVPALVEESMSLRFSRMDSSNAAQQSAIHHQRAIALLNGALDLYEGKWNVAIKVPIFGSNRLRPSFM